jgi:hypothetical protein
MSCHTMIRDGFVLRYIATIVTLYAVSKTNSKYHNLTLPILLYLLDGIDCVQYYKTTSCAFTFDYQFNDKLCDVISYWLLFSFFKVDDALLFFTFYRSIGVLLFYLTRDNRWLILFFDFVKEYLLYSFIFGRDYRYLPFFIILKIYFEYYWHCIKNNKDKLK